MQKSERLFSRYFHRQSAALNLALCAAISTAVFAMSPSISGGATKVSASGQGQNTSSGPASSAVPTGRVSIESFSSKNLQRDERFSIHLPPSYDASAKRYPVVYVLHGLFGSEQEWQRRGVAEAFERALASDKVGEVIAVMPNGGNSFYTNTADNKVLWEDMIVKELIPYVDSHYRTIADRKHRAISGTSMGGFGALKIAMKYPELFSAVSSMSAVLITQLPEKSDDPRTTSNFYYRILAPVFGDPFNLEQWKANDPMTLIDEHAAAIKKSGLRFLIECGTEDRYRFYEGAKVFSDKLERLGIPHDLRLTPGPHGWEYVLSVLEPTLLFHWKAFNEQ